MTHLSNSLTTCKSAWRKRGIAATVRNCLYETSHHQWLIEPPVNLLRNILMVIVDGRGNLDADEKRALPIEVREAAFDVDHYEKDAETRCLLVECIVLLCFHPSVAEKIKSWSGYAIMRELERFEKDQKVIDQILSAVDMLVREHEGAKPAQDVVVKESKIQEKEKEIQDLQREILKMNEEEKNLSVCNHCGKAPPEVTLMRCTGCRAVCFCSKKCQVANWKDHKVQCQKKKEELAN